MTPTANKSDEVYVDLWSPYNPLSLSRSVYAANLICKYTRKTLILYLRGKDDFMDAFQA